MSHGYIEVIFYNNYVDMGLGDKELKTNNISHLAAKLNFRDKSLFDKYIRGRKDIPHKAQNDFYEVYFSFWPSNTFSNKKNNYGILVTEHYDIEQFQSGLYQRFDTNFIGQELHSNKRWFHFPSISHRLDANKDYLPIPIIFHETRFIAALKNSSIPIINQNEIERVVNNIKLYCQHYCVWSNAVTNKQHHKEHEVLDSLIRICKQLKNDFVIFSKQKRTISNYQFISLMRSFITIGISDIQKMKLSMEQYFDLESSLNFIKNVNYNMTNNSTSHIYQNNASMVFELLKVASKHSKCKELSNIFITPCYFNLLRSHMPSYFVRNCIKRSLEYARWQEDSNNEEEIIPEPLNSPKSKIIMRYTNKAREFTPLYKSFEIYETSLSNEIRSKPFSNLLPNL